MKKRLFTKITTHNVVIFFIQKYILMHNTFLFYGIPYFFYTIL